MRRVSSITRGTYVAAMEGHTGKSVVTLGVVDMLSRRTERLGFFRPVVPDDPRHDHTTELVRRRYGLGPRATRACTVSEARELVSAGRADEFYAVVLAAYRKLARDCDVVVCEGSDYAGGQAAVELELNARIAVHLGTPAILVVPGAGKSAADVAASARLVTKSFAAEGVTIAGVVVNRCDPDRVGEVHSAIVGEVRDDGAGLVAVVPENPVLARPSVGQVFAHLDAKLVRSDDDALRRDVEGVKVAAMGLPNFLDHLSQGDLVLVPGDRGALILASLASALTPGSPSPSGLLLTGGLPPDEPVRRLMDNLPGAAVPIAAVDSDTYATAVAVSRVPAAIEPDNERKIAAALGWWESHVDVAALAARLEVARSERVTPLMFSYDLLERARSRRRHIVLPEGTEERVLRAAEIVHRRRVAELTLLGDDAAVRAEVARLGLDLAEVPVVDPARSPLADRFAPVFHELRRHKGVSAQMARDLMNDVSYFGTMMVHEGLADGMVSGAAHTTAHTIRPALEVLRSLQGPSIVSSVFFMCLPDRVLVYGDCAVNPDPNAVQLADIAISSADTAERFGVQPRVAMLSYSTGESGGGADVEKVREATRLVRERRPDLPVEGPIQYDAAIDASVARAKLPGSTVAGAATVFIFPDLNTGNNTYKAVQRSAGAVAIGPVLQGLRRPVNDLSRGATVTDIVNTIAITAIQA